MFRAITDFTNGRRLGLKWCVTGIVSLLLIPSCGSKSKEQPDAEPEVTVDVAPVLGSAISQRIVSDAVIYPVQQAPISSKITAPVKKIYVERGDRVHAGQLLAELENQDLTATLNEAKAALAQSEIAIQSVTAGVPHELSKVQIDIDGARQTVSEQQRIYDSRQILFMQGAIPEDVKESAFNLEQAKNLLKAAEAKVEDVKGPSKDQELKAAQAARDAANRKIDTAAVQLSYTQIKSPIDGVVTDRPVSVGETAVSGMPMMTVMDLSRVIGRFHVSPQDAAQLHPGMKANLIAPGLSPVAGMIAQISPAMDAGTTTVEIWIEAANAEGKLKPGMSLRAEAIVKSNPKALVIPAVAVLTSSIGNTSVMVVDNENKPHKKPVTLGIRDGANVEVIDGLQSSERVVTAGAFELEKMDSDVFDKTKVHIQLPKEQEEE